MNMGGRVQPRNSAFLCIVGQHVHDRARGIAATIGGRSTEKKLCNLARRADQNGANEHRGDVADALVREGDLVSGKDNGNGHHDNRDRVEEGMQAVGHTTGSAESIFLCESQAWQQPNRRGDAQKDKQAGALRVEDVLVAG